MIPLLLRLAPFDAPSLDREKLEMLVKPVLTS
jgi:hypothetical protein